MKSKTRLAIFIICFLALLSSAYAQSDKVNQPKPWENPKLSPTQRFETKISWDFYEFLNNDLIPLDYRNRLKSIREEGNYLILLFSLQKGIEGFWKANNRPPSTIEELYHSAFTSVEDHLQYQLKPLQNPISNKPIKIVPFSNPSPGDITYIYHKSYNGVNNVTLIIWDKKITQRNKNFAKLVEENGGVVKFMYRNQLFGTDYCRIISWFMQPSINIQLNWCQLPGQPMVYSDKNRNVLYEHWGDLLDGYLGLDRPRTPVSMADPILEPLEKALKESKEFAKYSDPKLTPQERWVFISDFLQSKQPETFKKMCLDQSKDSYLVKLDYALFFGFQQFAKQYKKLPASIVELTSSNLTIAGSETKIILPENIYFLRPVKQTIVDVPAPGDISYFLDNPANPKHGIVLVWSQSPDNEEMFWLQIIDKNFGLTDFFLDPQNEDFNIPKNLFFEYFFNSIDRVFFFTIDKDGKLLVEE